MDEDRKVPEDEFDALLASGKTLKVTLTPSRLKSFDVRPGVVELSFADWT